jgi:hypothetical protein
MAKSFFSIRPTLAAKRKGPPHGIAGKCAMKPAIIRLQSFSAA